MSLHVVKCYFKRRLCSCSTWLRSAPPAPTWLAKALAHALLWLLALALPLSAQEVIVSEFMAANSSGLKDEDGDFSDWIELYNPTKTAVSIAGWFLTNDRNNLSQWQFPTLTIPANGYLVVFASGKDRRDPKNKLHTNFKLDRGGEYLALVRSDGATVSFAFAPTYPPQAVGLSYGTSMLADTEVLVALDATARMLIPVDNQFGLNWVQPGFDDSTWTTVKLGVGYDRVPVYGSDPSEPTTMLADISQPGDTIVPTSSNSPGSEGVANAIDNNPLTKYLNFDKLNAGLTVTPSLGVSVVTGLRLTSANDAPERDPTSYLLLGSNDGLTFTEIARGAIPGFSGRFTPVDITLTNNRSWLSYRLLFPTVVNAAAAVAVQIAEVELLGWAGGAMMNFGEPIKTDLEPLMFNQHSSAYLRIPFVADSSLPRRNLSLRMRYDDGFVAFLNGVEVARANAPAKVAFDSVASTNRFRTAAMREELFDLSPFAAAIKQGTNLLAIQALNDRTNSPDYLLQLQLENTQVTLTGTNYLTVATPGTPNGSALGGLVSEVVFDRKHGFYDRPMEVGLYCATPETIIRYTTDGSVPTSYHGGIYTAPVLVDHTTLLRATAFRSNWHASATATRTFIFLSDVVTQDRAAALGIGCPTNWGSRIADYGLDPRVVGLNGQDKYGGKYTRSLQADLTSLPSMSIVMDQKDLFGSQGIYVNPESHGLAWERAASLELIYPDDRDGFQSNAGIRVQGGAFRRFDLTLKKSFRLIFREQYGSASLHYPLFGPQAADRFNNFVLRANSNDGWPYGGGNALYVRDAFAMDTARAMGMVSSHSTFVHLYVNGFYWGLYNPVERPDAAFSATYQGGDRETWDAINQDSVPDGTYDAWNRVLGLLNQGMADNANYQRIQGNNPDGTRNPSYENLLDIDNLIDYMILNFYIGNADWPGRNWWVGRDRNHGDGFQFYPWDGETALGLTGLEANVTGASGAVARPHSACAANPEYRLRFADHVYRHFFNHGALYVDSAYPNYDSSHPERNLPAARLFALSEVVNRAMVGESARWGDQLVNSPYTRDEHWLKARDSLISNYFPRRSTVVLAQFRQVKLYPQTDSPSISPQGGPVAVGSQVILSSTKGTIYYTTNGYDPRTPITGAHDKAQVYTQPILLRDRAVIKARVLNGQEWSALNETTFVVGDPRLALSEIHYHPAHATPTEQASGFSNADDFEFIEFCNPGTGSLDLTGVRITEGIAFDFGIARLTNLPAGAYLIIVKNRAAFEQRYGSGLPVAGEFTGQLNNAGEKITVVDRNNNVILNFTYGTTAPWPEQADGAGPSLEIIDAKGDISAASNWRPSLNDGGSPGNANPERPLTLSGVTQKDGQLMFWFQGKPGVQYNVQTSRSLQGGSWEPFLLLPAAATNQAISVVIDLATNPAPGLFRVIQP
jgi:hypothetical protein